jgi:hypothetical protein
MTTFWYLITALALLAAVINFILAGVRRKQMVVALVRGLAGVVSLGLAVGIVIGKAMGVHPNLHWNTQTVFIATGVFVFAVLFIPSYFDKSATPADANKVTLQQRAARPVKATVRLKDASADEWVN